MQDNARGEVRIQFDVAPQLGKRPIGRLEGDYAPRCADTLGHRQRMRADIRADIEYDISGAQERRIGGDRVALKAAQQIDCEVDALAQVQLPTQLPRAWWSRPRRDP